MCQSDGWDTGRRVFRQHRTHDHRRDHRRVGGGVDRFVLNGTQRVGLRHGCRRRNRCRGHVHATATAWPPAAEEAGEAASCDAPFFGATVSGTGGAGTAAC